MGKAIDKYSALSRQSKEYFRKIVELGEFDKLITLLKELKDTETDDISETSYSGEDLKTRINAVIKRLGITPNYKGYFYIETAVEYMFSRDLSETRICKDVYPYVQKVYNADSVHSVERGIRHAIQKTWTREENAEFVKELSKGFSLKKDVPTNSVFLTIIVEYLRS